MDPIASDGRDLMVSGNGGRWRVGWYPPPDPPPGTPHGAADVCVSDDQVVLISTDGQRWGLPVLVRSMWRAEVRLERWAPRFEIRYRRLLPANEALLSVLVAEPSLGPIYRRVFVEAALAAATS